jgi:hypothetical protein
MESLCKRKMIDALIVTLSLLLLSACGGGSPSAATGTTSSVTYSTTSNKGDYSEWTLDGNDLRATWNVENDAGGIDYSYQIVATCSAEAANGTRTCTIDEPASHCTDGLTTCPDSPSGTFYLMDAPGVALFVHTTDASYGSDQLHIGFAKNSDACRDDVSGDYTFIRVGLGLDENFGMFRSDADFIDVSHTDFGFDNGGSATTTPAIVYRTSNDTESYKDGGCDRGVRNRSLMDDSETFRAMITQSGLFLLDLPAGQGGLVAFKTEKAASLEDFANKSFKGISFPDNDDPQLLTATSGPVNSGPEQVSLSAHVGSSSMNLNVRSLSTNAAVGSLSAPAYPDFTAAPEMAAGAGTFNANPLAASYPTTASIPGMYKFETGLTDTGRVIAAAMKYNDKLIVVGMVYNHRTTSDTNPATGMNFEQNNLYNTGNFILFER